MQVRGVRFSVRTKYRTIYIKLINYILSSNQKYIVRNVILLFLLFGIFYSCSKKESTPPTPPVVTKLSGFAPTHKTDPSQNQKNAILPTLQIQY